MGETLVRATYNKTGGGIWKLDGKGTYDDYKKAKDHFKNRVIPLRDNIQKLNSQIVELLQSHQVGALRDKS